MYNKGFYFEIHDLLTQFIAAMDDVVIGRYNKNREEKEQIKVRYIHAPKERVIYDLINKAQNITVPAIAVNITSIQRDETRVFNKIDGFYSSVKDDQFGKYSVNVPMPIPVNLSVSVNIITNFQSDLDQIISNFVPYSNPYIIISWKIPDAFNMSHVKEIRSEVLWDGTVSLEYPVEATAADKFKFIGKTNFTIKGWLFPEAPDNYGKTIYFIDANFRTSSKVKLESLEYSALTGEHQNYDPSTGLLNETETVSISGSPYITNVYYNIDGKLNELSGYTTFKNNVPYISFLISGKNFNYTENILLSTNNSTMYNNLTSLNFTYYPTISGFVLPKSDYTILGNNTISLKLPKLSATGEFNLVVTTKVGWKDTNSINSKFIYYIKNKYFYATVNSSWHDINNWYDDALHTRKSNFLPNEESIVYIVQDSIKPLVNLDLRWVEPFAINSGSLGITFTSEHYLNVNCDITGDATFEGNTTYKSPNNKYFYSTVNSSWYDINNWYDDYFLTKPATSLPTNIHRVYIIENSITPFVNLDLNWDEPILINTGNVGITFTSQLSLNVNCRIIGNATFENTSTYKVPVKYFYSLSNNTWYNINNWYDDYFLSKPSASLPNNLDTIYILNNSINPIVNLDLNWFEPVLINTGTTTVTFSSENAVNVDCPIIGNATFIGNSTYKK
jgi:hypothetical protein